MAENFIPSALGQPGQTDDPQKAMADAVAAYKALVNDPGFAALPEDRKGMLVRAANDRLQLAGAAQRSFVGAPAPAANAARELTPAVGGLLAQQSDPNAPARDIDLKQMAKQSWPGMVGSLGGQLLLARLGMGPAAQGLGAAVGGAMGEGASQLTGNSPVSPTSLLLQLLPALPNAALSGKKEFGRARASMNPATPAAIAEDALKTQGNIAQRFAPVESSESQFGKVQVDPEYRAITALPLETKERAVSPHEYFPQPEEPVWSEHGTHVLTNRLAPQDQHIPLPRVDPIVSVSDKFIRPIEMTNAHVIMQNVKDYVARVAPQMGPLGKELQSDMSALNVSPTMNVEGIDTALKRLNNWRGPTGAGLPPDVKQQIGSLHSAIWDDVMTSPLGPQFKDAYHAYKRELVVGHVQDVVDAATHDFGGVTGIPNMDSLADALRRTRKQEQVMHDPSTPSAQGGPGVVPEAEWQALREAMVPAQREQKVWTRGNNNLSGSMIPTMTGYHAGQAIAGPLGGLAGAEVANQGASLFRRHIMDKSLATPTVRQGLLDAIRQPITGNVFTAASPAVMEGLAQYLRDKMQRESGQEQ
jgi:hypothetical protein